MCKGVKDLNYIWTCIDKNKQMDKINKDNFLSLINDYDKMVYNISTAKKNNTILTWVKDDKIESLHDLEKEFHEIMKYHINLIKSFSSSVELEKVFYCGK
jgi:hypothetical protein